MVQEQFAEWQAMGEEARAALSPAGACLRLSMFPSFANSLSFAADVRGGVLRLEWRRDSDIEKFHSPVERLRHPRRLRPTIKTTTAFVGQGQLQEWLARFSKIVIPASSPDGPSGLDGVSYELQLAAGFHAARYAWWHDGPPAWSPLTAAFHAVWQEMAPLPFTNASN